MKEREEQEQRMQKQTEENAKFWRNVYVVVGVVAALVAVYAYRK